uniref:Uncharacterized protein n=1 Tax=Romanomermis culicivorax TaxID=13658 RepID=A0A915KW94_ROMCU
MACILEFIFWAWRSNKSLRKAYSVAEHGDAKSATSSMKDISLRTNPHPPREHDIWHMTHWAPNQGSEVMQKGDFRVEPREECGVACELEVGGTL